MRKGISIIIPTYNGGRIFSECLEMIGKQNYGGQVQLIIIDSGSTDGTVESAKKAGAVIKRIEKREFHHARTRNAALSLANSDKVIFMVQDAVPCSGTWLSGLEQSLTETDVVAAYIDQVPHDDADVYARFEIESISKARGKKPVLQHLDSPESFEKMPYDRAYRSIGLDNVCAIYRKELLLNLPFPEVGFAEDIAWALKNMLLGRKVLYQPNIKVKHSHNRSPEYAFDRQVVNSFWCAKIMNRVRDDMSFLTVGDLMAMTNGISRFVNRLESDILGKNERVEKRHGKSPRAIDRILEKYSVRNRAKCFLVDKFPKNWNLRSPKLRAVEQQAQEGIQHVLNLIKRDYQVTDEQEMTKILHQSAANILGRIYGETYASCVLGGKVSQQLERFFEPFLISI